METESMQSGSHAPGPAVTGAVVVGVDGSEHANRAVVWAAEQAALEGRRLVVVHASPSRQLRDLDWLLVRGLGSEVEQVVAASARQLVEEAASLALSVRPMLDVHTEVVDADAREVLVEATHSAHLVVLGARGHSPWPVLGIGSVCAAVTRHATGPVVVAGRRATRTVQPGVLVGADGTAGSVPVIEFAFEQASLLGVPLTVMHCFWDVAGAFDRTVDPDDPGLEDLRLTLAESVAGLGEKYPDVELHLELARGLVDVALIDGTPPHDLVVVGHRHPSTWSRVVHGSAVGAILERAEGAVAVVPEPDPRR